MRGSRTLETKTVLVKGCVSTFNRMPCRDFQENFSCLYVCSQSPVSLDHGGMTFGTWSEMTFKSRVIPGSTTDSYDIGKDSARWKAASPGPVLASGLGGSQF